MLAISHDTVLLDRWAGRVLHLTGGGLTDAVVTYAALPDPETRLPAVALIAPAVLSSGDPLRPGPADLHGHHIAAHAVRHLAQLGGSDPGIRWAAAEDHDLWTAIRQATAAMPTGTHHDLLESVHSHAPDGPAPAVDCGVPVAVAIPSCDDGPAATPVVRRPVR